MIPHVAEAGEGSGRVVLCLGAAAGLCDVALEAAVRMAQAFQSEIESLFVADRQLFDLAAFPFASQVSHAGKTLRPLTVADMTRDVRGLAAAVQRKARRAAEASGIPIRIRSVEGDPVEALAAACAETGPWNVVTLGAPFTSAGRAPLAELFAIVRGTTGIVIAGPRARRTSGAVVAVVEDIERMAPMLRAAGRLAEATGGEPRLLVLGEDAGHAAWMEGQVRLALDGDTPVTLDVVDMSALAAAAVAERLRRVGAGFVIARFGGRFAETEETLAPLAALLEGPLFLVR